MAATQEMQDLVIKFVGGTTFVTRTGRSIEAVHPVSPASMEHVSTVIGRMDEWFGPPGAFQLDPGLTFLPLFHPDLSGESDLYWAWCPDGSRVTILSSADAVENRTQKMVRLAKCFAGSVHNRFGSSHARFVCHLRDGELRDGPAVSRSARHQWEFRTSGGHSCINTVPMVLSDVASYAVRGNRLSIRIADIDDDQMKTDFELPEGSTTLYVFNTPLVGSTHPANEIRHHLMARALVVNPTEFDGVPPLWSRTHESRRPPSATLPRLCSNMATVSAEGAAAERRPMLAPPDSEF